LRKNWRI